MVCPRAALVLVAAAALARAASLEDDPYLSYVRTAPEFKPLRQDPEMMIGRWDTWIYMPWRYRWHIGTGERGGKFCQEYGFNGGFTDHGNTSVLPWLEKWHLRFYNDHTAGKGYLHLHRRNWKADQRNPRAVRNSARGPRPLDDEMLEMLKDMVTRRVTGLRGSPVRVAYALDDEVSWGSFVRPIPWRIHEDDADYARWLESYYGEPRQPQYVTAEFVRKQLDGALRTLDFAPFLDRMTYNDSYWANFIGKLVETANAADPETPCGFVGGQSPNLFGGYDYAKLCKKIQFIEAYNIGSSQAVIRSFNPANAMPQVTTHFHKDSRGTANDIWQTWYYFAHGNRGMIGWVEGWFERDGTPRPWLDAYKPTMKEVGHVQGSKLVGSRWIHDGVALYYSHPSIQVSWCLDIQPHGSTWVNRNGDCRLGTSHLVRKAWERLLTDAGIQYSFIPYDEVIREGVPEEYKVVVLPACFALSDVEAHRFRQFVERGGTLVADFMCGLFDQHGKGRARGALDDLFGVSHDGSETQADFFGPRLWVETDQDRAYSYKSYRQLLETVPATLRDGYAIAEKKLPREPVVRKVGEGRAVYLNLSPQRYLMHRQEGKADSASRQPFLRHVREAGCTPWVTVTDPQGNRPYNCEVTYWHHPRADRTYCFVLQNAEVTGSAYGGGGVEGLIEKKTTITVAFPAPVRDLVDERTGRKHGTAKAATFDFNPVEAVFLSFAGRPPPPTR
ncbi:MAG: beta-galactosidase trimerization domain-containing protein [Candidatus Brocadiia bacterium]